MTDPRKRLSRKRCRSARRRLPRGVKGSLLPVMQEGKASFSAEIVTTMRAIEHHRGAERICSDPLAHRLVRPSLRLVGLTPGLQQAFLAYVEGQGPGFPGGIVARTRYIDELLEARLQHVEQLVILGAGHDTRAHRIAGCRALRVFEVDEPATQLHKRRRLGTLGMTGEHVTYVPVDFNRDDLSERMRASGFDAARPSFFIWEGVTFYLEEAAVERTLAFMRDGAPATTSVYFDYMLASVLDGRSELPEARAIRRTRSFRGDGAEAYTFAIEDGTVGEFLQARGFRLQQERRGADLHRAYFVGRHKQRRVHQLFGYVHAMVAPGA